VRQRTGATRLSDDVAGAGPADAVDGGELADLAQPGLGQRLDPGGDGVDLRGVAVDEGQHHRQDGGVLDGEEGAVERFLQAGDLAPHPAQGQLSQDPGVALPGGDGLQHGPAGLAVDVSQHR